MTDSYVLAKLGKLEQRIYALEEYLKQKEKDKRNEPDTLYEQAEKMVKQYDAVSASLLQRRLSIGYARASRLLDQLENNGIIAKGEGARPRPVLVRS